MKYMCTEKSAYVHETINFHTFSGGEVHVNISNMDINPDWKIKLFARIDSSAELMKLLVLTDAIRRNHRDIYIELEMPYIPYARQDRACAKGDAFSLKVFCDIINSQNYSRVVVADSHSMVATALINNVVEKEQKMFAPHLVGHIDQGIVYEFLVSPDAGASKKSAEFATSMWCSGRGLEVVQSLKVRDNRTGAIVSTNVLFDNFHAANILIVDDICDGGRTFIELAKILREKGANDIGLYVTHGIFSQGLGVLFDNGIDHIYTTDSFEQKDARANVIYSFFGG